MIREIHSVAVMVSDAQRSSDWYTQKLGLERKSESQDHWVVVGPKGAGTGLHLCQAGFMGSTLEPGNTGVLLSVDDLEKTVRELKGRGVEFAKDVTREQWGSYAIVKDPDGNEFWLMA